MGCSPSSSSSSSSSSETCAGAYRARPLWVPDKTFKNESKKKSWKKSSKCHLGFGEKAFETLSIEKVFSSSSSSSFECEETLFFFFVAVREKHPRRARGGGLLLDDADGKGIKSDRVKKMTTTATEEDKRRWDLTTKVQKALVFYRCRFGCVRFVVLPLSFSFSRVGGDSIEQPR